MGEDLKEVLLECKCVELELKVVIVTVVRLTKFWAIGEISFRFEDEALEKLNKFTYLSTYGFTGKKQKSQRAAASTVNVTKC